MRLALFRQAVQIVGSIEFGKSLEPSGQHIFNRSCVSQRGGGGGEERTPSPPKWWSKGDSGHLGD